MRTGRAQAAGERLGPGDREGRALAGQQRRRMGGVPGQHHPAPAPPRRMALGDEVVVERLRGAGERPVDLRVQAREASPQAVRVRRGPGGVAAVDPFGEHDAHAGGVGGVQPAGALDGVRHELPVAELAGEVRVLEEVARRAVPHGDDLPMTGGDVLAERRAHPVAGDHQIGVELGAVGELDRGSLRRGGTHTHRPRVVAEVHVPRERGQQAQLHLGAEDREAAPAGGVDQGAGVDPAGLGAVGCPVAHALEHVATAAELLDDAHALGGAEAGAEEVDHGAAAARSRRGLQHGDVVVGGELVGEGEAGDAAADDRDIHAPDATGPARTRPWGDPEDPHGRG